MESRIVETGLLEELSCFSEGIADLPAGDAEFTSGGRNTAPHHATDRVAEIFRHRAKRVIEGFRIIPAMNIVGRNGAVVPAAIGVTEACPERFAAAVCRRIDRLSAEAVGSFQPAAFPQQHANAEINDTIEKRVERRPALVEITGLPNDGFPQLLFDVTLVGSAETGTPTDLPGFEGDQCLAVLREDEVETASISIAHF